ncbi:dolichyl-phosphate beta-glucosyltransferase Alg5 [Schizosaccharomyces japonicus yFS275]|uniref:dolichyl-phosphate beta-glucosyltransferase n=1 Tax=Schizosaccharomyces japonicus (strain yFS275 / FY16936) TaxID=402676 RepID=B6JVI3_SCHJY|nr:dolichyl-phosphate beta-glucosyltransferase Alg5 [Schizosaccharomyces japonicus yFS275]EEB05384.1 dolichyl-phosphate beta-glucosyltransferase Alg5 [Schizosaccharomyces japonicus yFS275]
MAREALLFFLLVTLCVALILFSYLKNSHNPRKPLAGEDVYLHADENGRIVTARLKRHDTDPDIKLSVVVPAFNESDRIINMLEEAVAHLDTKFKQTVSDRKRRWEIIVVNDASTDRTVDAVLEYSRSKRLGHSLRVCSLQKNRGKGGAVTWGMMHARGDYAIFADADGASRFSDIDILFDKLVDNEYGSIAIGSRAHMVNTDAVVKRSRLRNFLMHGFHSMLRLLGIRDIGDTQCGFKLFSRDAYSKIFPMMHVEGWIFDIEVLILARFHGVTIVEVPITWHEVGGSKMMLLKDSIRMAIDLLVIRLNYTFGIWRRPRVK